MPSAIPAAGRLGPVVLPFLSLRNAPAWSADTSLDEVAMRAGRPGERPSLRDPENRVWPGSTTMPTISATTSTARRRWTVAPPSGGWVDLRGEYRLNRQWSFHADADDVFDFTQSRKESFLWLNKDGEIDVTHRWVPNRGRFVHGGVKFSL